MKSKILKISVSLLLILAMTMTNIIYVGNSLISYALDSFSTNNSNVEFNTYFKNEKGESVSSLDIKATNLETSLYLYLNVKNEGYIRDAQIELQDPNFTIEEIDSPYVNEIKDNIIILNQINAGRPVEIEIKIQMERKDNINIDLIDSETEMKLTGIYRDSTEKDIKIQSTKTIDLNLVEENTELENNVEIVTNKILKVAGENKRVIQIAIDTGLRNNNFPLKEITGQVKIPEIGENKPEVYAKIEKNSMTEGNYKYENGELQFSFKNVKTEQNKVLWRIDGKERIIVTCIYNEEVEIENEKIETKITATLYNDKKAKEEKETTITGKEKEKIITSTTKNADTSIYKGKIYNGIDREFTTTETISINMKDVLEYVEIKEENRINTERIEEIENLEGTNEFKYIYKSTIINKEELEKVLGEKGVLIIKDKTGEVITTIDKNTEANEEGDIVIDYREGKEGIVLRIVGPESNEKIRIKQNKIIKENSKEEMQNSRTMITALYITSNIEDEEKLTSYALTSLEESQTEAKINIDKTELSTVVENQVEMKVVLKTNSEENDLYENPVIRIEMPKEVEEIQINSIELALEEELKIRNYNIEGNIILIELEGKQTQYKDIAIEGANIIINAKIKINKRVATKEEKIEVEYTNQNANIYAEGNEIGKTNIDIKVVAPTDITLINTIKELSIEEMEQGATKETKMALSEKAQTITPQIDVINNKEVAIENVRIIGRFPNNNEENTMDIKLIENIVAEGANIYYTENGEATQDINNVENGWTNNIGDITKAKKFLITAEKMEPQKELTASYKAEIPGELEYNKNAELEYEVMYVDSETKVETTVKSTEVKLTTGQGPIMEANLSLKVGNDEIKAGDEVKAGEVIKYTVELSNTGTEDIENAKVSIPVPEGMVYVRPKANYEYTGSVYYEEINNKNIQETIEKIETGSKIVKEYELKVKNDIQDNRKITNVCKIMYGEVTKSSNEIEITAKSGNTSIVVKRITDRTSALYENGTVQYFAIVENTSDKKIDNVKVQTNLSKGLNVERLVLITGMKENDISNIISVGNQEIENQEEREITESELTGNVKSETTSQEIEYNEEIDIGSLETGEKKVLSYNLSIGTGIDQINFSAIAKQSSQSYRSNIWTDEINKISVDMQMESNIEDEYVKSGDIIEYTIIVKNNSNAETEGLLIKDEIPSQLTIHSITKDGEEVVIPEEGEININDKIKPLGQSVIKVVTVVDYSEARDEAEPITNKAIAEFAGKEIATTEEITHIIEADVESDNNQNGDNGVNNDIEDNNIASGNKIISGIAFEDTNANGKKDEGEPLLEGIKVKLLNVETNEFVKDKSGNILKATTNENGTYILNNIGNGKYIVIFEYDTVGYTITKYKAEGVLESQNSDVIKNRITINGEEQDVTSTDIITVNEDNISNINIGLTKLKNFDLKLDKYVNKIILQNSSGNTVKEYTEEKIAKVELDSKLIIGTRAVVEYKIKVTNVGEVEGYAKKIVDYVSSDFQFSSEMNNDWYQSGDNLYNSSLANEKIMPGESKDITLTLIKEMTENNIGLVNNTAEIAEDYNQLGITDSNSTPENNAKGENDMGSADVIISIRTGADLVLYTVFYIGVIAAISVGIVIPLVKKTRYVSRNKNKNRKKLDKI